MRSLLIALAIVFPIAAQDPTAADFDAQIAKLTPKATKEERLQVAKWVHRQFASTHAPRVVPALEQLILKDPDADVRREAVAALVNLLNRHDVECPVGLIVALRDPVDEVRWSASVLGKPFQRKLAPGALDALIAATADERPGVRSTSLLHLADAAGKDAKARAAIEKAKTDKSFEVQHTAHIAWFKATDDLAALLTYMVRVREEPDTVLAPFPKDSEEAKNQMCMRNLFMLGSAIRMIEWSEERPDDLATALLKLLDDKSAAMRRGAADLIGAAARKTEIQRSGPLNALDLEQGSSSPLLPYLDATAKPDSKKPIAAEPILPSKAFARLLKGKAPARLRYVATMDPDLTVRAAARLALGRFAEVPEPLDVQPREVTPR